MFNYKYDDLINPCFQAIKNLGGSAKNEEIKEELIKILNLTDEEINDPHRDKNGSSKLEYRSAWARTYLKNAGYIDNSSRGVWAITELGNTITDYDIKLEVKAKTKAKMDAKKEDEIELEDEEEIEEFKWKGHILEIVKNISPEKFEKLCQRLLRELGFVNVEVTGKSHDGGIDGKGILKLGGVLSFHVAFQSKRYNGTVSSNVVRDFRGAIMGRADKGVIITTGTFSREAVKEAIRDGAIPIDLIDGNDLATHLKELGLGVDVKLVEKVIIKESWFDNI